MSGSVFTVKQRRAERIDSTRQLDFFADLNLGPSDDEAEDDAAQDGPSMVRDGVAQFASMLPPSSITMGATGTQSIVPSESAVSPPQASEVQSNGKKRGKHKRKPKATSTGTRHSNKKPNKWADKCMYAELLEMMDGFDQTSLGHDGIPEDIEKGWVAVTPVPVGKRCLAITHQASGIAGVSESVL